jgi:hypothetical protein
MPLSSLCKFKCVVAASLGLPAIFVVALVVADKRKQATTYPRSLPTYSRGNPAGYGEVRPFQHYGAPFYGGVGSNISPMLSLEEFRSHFMFGPEKIPDVLNCLRFPATPGRVGDTFPVRFDSQGQPIRWVSPETALLVFLKRMRTRGSVVIQLQSFFGRSIGWISEVFNAVVQWIVVKWVPLKIQTLDTRVFNRWRLQDYANCLWRAGLLIPGIVGFVDGDSKRNQ